MEQRELATLLELNLARQLHWVGFADSKAVFVFALSTAMLGLLGAIAPRSVANWTLAPAVCAVFAGAFGIASVIALSFASFPRTGGPQGSMIYCGGIAQLDADQFRLAMLDLTIEVYLEDLAAQCHRNAEIATRKFTWIQRALFFLYLSVVPWVLALWLLFNTPNR